MVTLSAMKSNDNDFTPSDVCPEKNVSTCCD